VHRFECEVVTILASVGKEVAKDKDGIVWGEMLGKGGYGSVYACHIDSVEYAAKRMRITPNSKDMLLREVAVMQKLSHKNLVPLVKRFVRESEVILIMPLFSTSLESELQRRYSAKKYYEPREVVSMMQEMTEGLEYLHKFGEKGIAHRDLKVKVCWSETENVKRVQTY
jgi:serine/threonine protein kinase